MIESLDGMARMRHALKEIAAKGGEWAGIPMPLDGMPMVVEPRYPFAPILEKLGNVEVKAPPDAAFTSDAKIRNSFWSWRWRCEIVVGEVNGKITWGKIPRTNNVAMQLDTLGASDAWGIDQERHAIDTLGTLLRHRQFKQYLLTGCFLEKSERSGVHYIFRRLRPTIAFSTRVREGEDCRMLCALCMHPIGYYRGSWAGAMCPTDDVIAHLMLMRGDEHMFWRKCNQHPLFVPEAGV